MKTKLTDSPPPVWKKHMTYIRDAVFVILFLVTVAGWARSSIVQKTKIEYEVSRLNDTMKEITMQLDKINNILLDQKELNGKIIQYMQQK